MRSGPAALLCFIALTALSAGCGDAEEPGTSIRISNGTGGTLAGLTLVIGSDTLAIDSLTTGSIAEWTLELDVSEKAVFLWTITGLPRSVEVALIDSVHMASVVEFFIPSGDVDLTISYHF